jgi:hypothetical protein
VPTKDLLQLIEETGHVGELSRLLSTFKKRHTGRLGKAELIELANRSAGASYRYPNPEPALMVAIVVGLLRRDGRYILLTETGKLFLRLESDNKADVTREQASLLLGLLLDDDSINMRVGALFRFFGKGSSGKLEAKSSPATWDRLTLATAKILQQLGVLEEYDGKLFLNTVFEPIFPRHLLRLTALNEQALWARLEAQRIRAKRAEEIVLLEEQKRLFKLGRPDLAELVVRISAEDVSAGYDIGSFDRDGAPRFIEVKSSSGRAIRFEWSVREREVAFYYTRRYWIYFVPFANIVERRNFPILMLRNPAHLISIGKLTETASSFVVYSSAHLSTAISEAVSRARLKEWPT